MIPKTGRPKGAKNIDKEMSFKRNIFVLLKQRKICKSIKKSAIELMN